MAEEERRPASTPVEADPEEPEPTLAHYFGGYALIFVGVIGLALAFVLLTKLLR